MLVTAEGKDPRVVLWRNGHGWDRGCGSGQLSAAAAAAAAPGGATGPPAIMHRRPGPGAACRGLAAVTATAATIGGGTAGTNEYFSGLPYTHKLTD